MTREKIISLARECGYQHPDAVGTCEDFAYFDLEAFYHKAQAEAFEAVAVACDSIARGWKNNPGNAPMAGYIASSNCAAVSREMAKEVAKEMKEKQNAD